MTLEELKKKLQSLKDAINKEEDETKKKEIQANISDLESQIKKLEDGKKNEEDDPKIPLYKYKNLKDKYDQLDAKVKELEDLGKKKKEADLKDQNKFKELVDEKEKEISNFKEEIDKLKSNVKNERVNTLLREAVMAVGPKDINDVLPLIKESDYKVIIDDNGVVISIEGLEEILADMQKNKDYLFGAPPGKNDNRKPNENGKHNAPGEGDDPDLETKFKTLLEKKDKTPSEQAALTLLATEVKKARQEKEEKK